MNCCNFRKKVVTLQHNLKLLNFMAMNNLEILLYSLLFVLIGLMLVSFFLVWTWFDARERLKVVREITRDETVRAIRRSHNKCRILLFILLALVLPAEFWWFFLAACLIGLGIWYLRCCG